MELLNYLFNTKKMSESELSRKRTRGTPTGSTGNVYRQHYIGRSCPSLIRVLSGNTLISKVPGSWTDKAEDKALVEFILLSGLGVIPGQQQLIPR